MNLNSETVFTLEDSEVNLTLLFTKRPNRFVNRQGAQGEATKAWKAQENTTYFKAM